MSKKNQDLNTVSGPSTRSTAIMNRRNAQKNQELHAVYVRGNIEASSTRSKVVNS